MQWIDVAAGVAARRHAGAWAVTASMDSMKFHLPIQLGDVVVLRASVNRAWRTSMEVGVRVEVEQLGTDEPVHAASAYLTFVAVDEGRRPTDVPPVAPQNEVDRRRYAEADWRRRRRLESAGKDVDY
jgi:acyl-CoA hydrolase